MKKIESGKDGDWRRLRTEKIESRADGEDGEWRRWRAENMKSGEDGE